MALTGNRSNTCNTWRSDSSEQDKKDYLVKVSSEDLDNVDSS